MYILRVALGRPLAQETSPPPFAVEPLTSLDTNTKTGESIEPRVSEIPVIDDIIEAAEHKKALEDVSGNKPQAASKPDQNWSRGNIKISDQLFSDPTNDVPVLLSIKVLHGDYKGRISYHYFFKPPPFWDFPRHGVFTVIDSPLLPVNKKQTKAILLDRKVKEVFCLAKISVVDIYRGETTMISLGPGKWLNFITDHDGSEIPMDTTLRELIHKFLKSKPIAGSPLIITPTEAYEKLRSHKLAELPVLERNKNEYDKEKEKNKQGSNYNSGEK